jgi:hypothetical protein
MYDYAWQAISANSGLQTYFLHAFPFYRTPVLRAILFEFNILILYGYLYVSNSSILILSGYE